MDKKITPYTQEEVLRYKIRAEELLLKYGKSLSDLCKKEVHEIVDTLERKIVRWENAKMEYWESLYITVRYWRGVEIEINKIII